MATKVLSPIPEDNPVIYDEVPDRQSSSLTDYDKRNLKTYLRLLDAENEGMPWEEAASVILKRDVDADPVKAKNTWCQHVERAIWITKEGWRELADDPEEMLKRMKGEVGDNTT